MNKLILVLAICSGLAACSSNSTKKGDTATVEQTQSRETKDHVEILYFHGKQRCATCMAIEKNAKEAIEMQFADELKKGTVVFKTIDISKPENEKIAEKYEVTWSSLFISQWTEGKETYENLTEYAFANARNAPDTFKNGLIEKVKVSLNKIE
ncbi:MAG: nitrophenyl compound nitroreductase subunit ArsF family protein [Paludibacter sp.]|nr:nitrophenyl compound nitroreductase subunit ArsF family protein [Bacteroidales bacterium]MCM1069514.1 nitrophenyl compound nitroreductase subunit ArsF family protein [Prevotella sp.]MCM1354170.1 nitrophenyl compound nitroreductase subunit ArsF family protein [Bacteroides sp.]MCM1442973.1 nitrophenyl compound nitroreductase subunit ArsF family protein [Muribaculum sp.]MCM1482245.1 nitrophenyl compound nitroreductase subunit ArsF family protein [Paludibacter sp.]